LGIQGLNNARFFASGSLDLFSNDFFNKFEKGGNRQLAKNSISWLMGERGVVREISTKRKHGCTGLEGKQEIGTIDCPVRSKFRFETELEFWNWEKKAWEPYIDDSLYLEITMMTPKFRKYFVPDAKSPGKYSIQEGVSKN
jgi:oligosaccharyltransferase complex subunit beta